MHRHKAQPNELSVDNTARLRIIAAARRHFFAHGIRSVTMDDLAEELGMSKKTLYAAFPSKVALLQAVLMDKFRTIDADLEGITSGCSGDFLAALHQLLACMQRHLEEIQPSFLREIRRESPEMFEMVERRRREVIHRQFGKLLSEGRKAGIVRKDIPSELVLEILLGAVQAIMNPPKLAELGLTPKAGLSAILAVFFEGVITEQGRARQ